MQQHYLNSPASRVQSWDLGAVENGMLGAGDHRAGVRLDKSALLKRFKEGEAVVGYGR
jgi:hypothetical protein